MAKLWVNREKERDRETGGFSGPLGKKLRVREMKINLLVSSGESRWMMLIMSKPTDVQRRQK